MPAARPKPAPAASAEPASASGSRQRIADHGEVFTPPGLVRDMLNLPGVADECLRVDARFLEPACGDGNFLAEVLRRRLGRVSETHPKRALIPWERDALRGLANLYGIELLPDNAGRCRARLVGVFEDLYRGRFKAKARDAVVGAARRIAAANVLLGDALSMRHPSTHEPLVFTQWSMLTGGRFKRKRFEYRELLDPERPDAHLFGRPATDVHAEDGKPVFLPRAVGDLPFVHYLDLASEADPCG